RTRADRSRRDATPAVACARHADRTGRNGSRGGRPCSRNAAQPARARVALDAGDGGRPHAFGLVATVTRGILGLLAMAARDVFKLLAMAARHLARAGDLSWLCVRGEVAAQGRAPG